MRLYNENATNLRSFSRMSSLIGYKWNKKKSKVNTLFFFFFHICLWFVDIFCGINIKCLSSMRLRPKSTLWSYMSFHIANRFSAITSSSVVLCKQHYRLSILSHPHVLSRLSVFSWHVMQSEDWTAITAHEKISYSLNELTMILWQPSAFWHVYTWARKRKSSRQSCLIFKASNNDK